MIVTCESCKSRYKLDDAKITGKGAKITCPKCRNVFVVYARDTTENPTDRGSGALKDPTREGAGSNPGFSDTGSAGWKPAKSGGLADAVKGTGAVPSPSGMPGRVVASGSAPVGGPKSPVAPPGAWDDEPTRVGGTNAPPEEPVHEVARPAAPAATPAEASAGAARTSSQSPAEVAARAATLDFRKVGVTTWKVKVKIGLIYDFSDIKTLRKYIQDGRVTPADVVSWDGKAWRAIGEIPDLDAFFVETWDMLAARKVETPTPSPTPAVAEAPRAEETTPLKSGGEPNQFRDPFADLKPKQQGRGGDAGRKGAAAAVVAPQKRTDGAATPSGNNRLPLALLLLLLLIGGGGAAWWMNQAPPAPPAPGGKPPATQPSATGAAGKTAEEMRAELNKELERQAANNPAPDPLPGDSPDPGALVPVRPSGRTQPVASTPNGVPEGARPVVPRPSGVAPSNMRQADQTAADHEAVGDDAASSGDWQMAAQAYQKAVTLDGKSAKLAGKLGRALYESKDYDRAQPYLTRAANGGWNDAHKYLGHIARLNGDPAAANPQYQQYLNGSPRPRDAAEIEALMSGG